MASILAHKLKVMEGLADLTRFYLPRIPCSTPHRCNPDFIPVSQLADEDAFQILGRSSVQEKKLIVQSRIPLYTCLWLPYRSSIERSAAVARFMWHEAFMDDMLDDQVLESGKVNAWLDSLLDFKNIASLNSPRQVPAELLQMQSSKGFRLDRFLPMYYDLLRDFQRLMSPPVFQRFIHALKNWAASFEKLNDSRSLFSAETYASFRRSNVFLATLWPSLEMCMDITLKDEDLQSDDYLAAFSASIDYHWMVNEVLSVPVDLRKKRYVNFLFVLLYTDPGINTFQEAVNKVCTMIQDKEREFLYYHQILIKNAKAKKNHDFERYLEQIPYGMAGHLHWHYLTARYHGVDNPCITGEKFHGHCFIHPTHTIVYPDVPPHPYLLDV